VAAERILAPLAGDPSLAAAIRREAEAVLSAPELQPLFAPDSRAEVAIVGDIAASTGTYAVSGQIDRLLREGEGWRLVDFKTDRSVPAGADDIAPGYVLQLALYRRLLEKMQPGAPVSAALVYTGGAEGPKILPVPAAAMEKALAGLGVCADSLP
jgi:ATP-dependent helicase/nuclease subunit A